MGRIDHAAPVRGVDSLVISSVGACLLLLAASMASRPSDPPQFVDCTFGGVVAALAVAGWGICGGALGDPTRPGAWVRAAFLCFGLAAVSASCTHVVREHVAGQAFDAIFGNDGSWMNAAFRRLAEIGSEISKLLVGKDLGGTVGTTTLILALFILSVVGLVAAALESAIGAVILFLALALIAIAAMSADRWLTAAGAVCAAGASLVFRPVCPGVGLHRANATCALLAALLLLPLSMVYFFVPVDFIPEVPLVIVGWTDDLGFVGLTLWLIFRTFRRAVTAWRLPPEAAI